MEKKIHKKEFVIKGLEKRKLTLDLTYPETKKTLPVVVFCHGFKGFKDWGHFNWVAQKFAENEMAFLKFNFSFNGITPDNLNELTDLEAFSENNYSKELKDLDLILEFIVEQEETLPINTKEIYIIGHSRGGGIAFLKSLEDKRIKKTVLWASLSDFESFFRKETIQEWEEKGVVMVENKRTKQLLPLKKQFYDDYISNKKTLDIRQQAKLFDKPLLIIHGDKDEAVDVSHAEFLYNTIQHSIFIKVENGDHTFGAKHPFNEAEDVTEMLEELVENSIEFMLD